MTPTFYTLPRNKRGGSNSVPVFIPISKRYFHNDFHIYTQYQNRNIFLLTGGSIRSIYGWNSSNNQSQSDFLPFRSRKSSQTKESEFSVLGTSPQSPVDGKAYYLRDC